MSLRVRESGSSGDGKFLSLGVQEMRRLRNGEFVSLRVHDLGGSGDVDFVSLRVKEMRSL